MTSRLTMPTMMSERWLAPLTLEVHACLWWQVVCDRRFTGAHPVGRAVCVMGALMLAVEGTATG